MYQYAEVNLDQLNTFSIS